MVLALVLSNGHGARNPICRGRDPHVRGTPDPGPGGLGPCGRNPYTMFIGALVIMSLTLVALGFAALEHLALNIVGLSLAKLIPYVFSYHYVLSSCSLS